MYKVADSGVLKKIETWSVIVPLVDNDGHAFSKELVDGILQDILLNYPGFSVSNVIGYWKGSDRTYVDQNYQLLIDTIPRDDSDSSAFFVNLKQSLQERLRQEKIYVTKQDCKEELISFTEFFQEIGVQVTCEDARGHARRIVESLAANFAFVEQRLGYETTLLRRDVARNKILWERKLCGIGLRSEFDDRLPSNVQIIAADQYDLLGAALAQEEVVAIIGTYEFLMYSLDRRPSATLVDSCKLDLAKYKDPYIRSPSGALIDVRTFIQEFTAGVFVNCLILREEGFFPNEVRVNVGLDGSLQHASNGAKGILLHSPAVIPDVEVQLEIIECLGRVLDKSEDNLLDPMALAQAKAKNNYFLKRSIVRHVLRGGAELE